MRSAYWLNIDPTGMVEASWPSSARPASERKPLGVGRHVGRKSYAELRPETVALAKQMHANGVPYRKISAALAAQGHVTSGGQPYVVSAIQKMLGRSQHERQRPPRRKRHKFGG